MSGVSDTRATTGPGQSAAPHVGGVLERSDELAVLAGARAEVSDEGRGRSARWRTSPSTPAVSWPR